MIPLGLFLWTAVIKPILAWFRGQPADKALKGKGEGDGDKALGDKGEGDGEKAKTPPEKAPDDASSGTGGQEDDKKGLR